MKKDQTSGLGFNGQDNSDKPGGYSKKFQTSQAKTPANPDRINAGCGPRRAGTTGDDTGVSTAKSGKINGGATVKTTMKGYYGRGPQKGNE